MVVGFYQHEAVVEKIRDFARVAIALNFSHGMRVAMFGSNMRDVAVTDGDRVESEIRYGWNVNYYGIGDLVELANAVTEQETDEKMSEYEIKYELATKDIKAVREQAKYEIALEKFLARERISAFTDNFQDLHGLKQLPGLAVQNLMANGVGFGAEGDYGRAYGGSLQNGGGQKGRHRVYGGLYLRLDRGQRIGARLAYARGFARVRGE